MPVTCNVINCDKPAVLKRPKTGHALCKECFFYAFETEIHVTIVKGKLFKRGDKVAIGASGGKDSTVLAYVLKLLNDRYDYGLDLFLLSIDEGITGYRDDSLETVKQNRDDYKLPLKILSYKDLYGWTMDEIVAQIGKKNNCTFCGVFRRQALDRGAALLKADMIVTGHNADDIAETVIMNVLRGDLARLSRCTNIITEGEGTIPRCKPLKYAYEKEIVMYAHYKNLVYFSTECIYAPNAYRGHTREYIKDIERVRPSCILDIIHSGEIIQVKKNVKFPKRQTCSRCGFVASQEICKACVLLEGLNIGMPKLGIGKSNKAKKIMGLQVLDGSENKSKKKPNNDSKRKIKRETKKKGNCVEDCSTSCLSRNFESLSLEKDTNELASVLKKETPCTLTNSASSISIKDNDSATLILETSPCNEDISCTSETDCSEMPLAFTEALNIDSSEDEEKSIIEIKEKNEKVICKCPPRLRPNPQESHNTEENTDDSSSDEGIFDLDLLMSFIDSQKEPFYLKPEVVDLFKNEDESSTVDELEELLSQFWDDTSETQPSASITKETANQESVPMLKEIANLEATVKETTDLELQETVKETTNLDSPPTNYSNTQKEQPSLIVEEIASSGSQSSGHLDNENKSISEKPVIIKANPRKIKPSLMLPEMMYKAPNNLDF